jgi:hypothetical protein
MAITANLHEVLVRLRNRVIERVIWIDAICIDQGNITERGDQIRHMAEIYCKANRVIVWLGESADDSDQVLKSIRRAADEEVPRSSDDNVDGQSILTMLKRPWFRRIWVRCAYLRTCGMHIDTWNRCSKRLPPLKILSLCVGLRG